MRMETFVVFSINLILIYSELEQKDDVINKIAIEVFKKFIIKSLFWCINSKFLHFKVM